MAQGRTGRRPGRPDTRADILAAARRQFADHGFAGTSVRAVASAAGVDPALVHHYFGTKEGLFRATIDIPLDMETVLARISGGGPDEAARRLVETLLEVWDSAELGPAVAGFLRRVVAEDEASGLLRDVIGPSVFQPAALELLDDPDAPDAHARLALVLSQVLGLALLRRVLCIEPIVSMSAADVADAVAPTIARYLRGGTHLTEGSPS